MSPLPRDFPKYVPPTGGQPRCRSVYEGKRCRRAKGHEEGLGKNPRHHIAVDETRWTVGRKSGVIQQLNKCGATYGEHRCDRWPHHGPHGATVDHPPGKLPRRERIEWIGNGAGARRYAPESVVRL